MDNRCSPPQFQTGREWPGRVWWSVTAAILMAATVLRICNLASFSLWLDEVVTIEFSALPLPKLLAASAGDAENVPVYLIVTYLARLIGLDEPWIRLPSILAGLGSILLLMVWTRRRFGECVALLTGAFCALSPFHIRYSQELRAYPYLLLMVTLTLLAGDRLRHRPNLVSTAALATTITIGCYTHLSYPLVLVPLVVAVLGPDGRVVRKPSGRTIAGRFAVAIAVGVAAFLPWLFLITDKLGERMVRNVREWNLERVGDRWHFLTVAPYEHLDVGWLGIIAGVFAVVGIVAAWRYPAGRAVLLVSLPTLVAWEVTLAAIRHWSDGRYDTVLWPFLAVIIGLGVHTMMRMLRWWWLRATVGLLLAVAILVQVDTYQRAGRPAWTVVAQAIEHVRRPDEPILTVNDWSRLCVSHYLETPVRSIDGDVGVILGTLARQPSVLLVFGGWPGSGEVRRLARRQTILLRIPYPPRDTYLYRISADFVDRDRLSAPRDTSEPIVWPEPAAELLPDRLQARRKGCLDRILPVGNRQTEGADPAVGIRADARAFAGMGSGWSPLKTRSDGTTYRWVAGREASLQLPGSPETDATIQIRLRPPPELADWQMLRLVINGHDIGTTQLRSGYQTITIDVPGAVWRYDRNLLVLQFRGALPNPDSESPWIGPPPRAAAVDWVEIHPIPK